MSIIHRDHFTEVNILKGLPNLKVSAKLISNLNYAKLVYKNNDTLRDNYRQKWNLNWIGRKVIEAFSISFLSKDDR